MYTTITPVENLVFKSDFSLDITTLESADFVPRYNFHAENFRPQNTVSSGRAESSLWQWENTVSYSRQMGKHFASVVLGSTALKENRSFLNGQRNGIPDAYQNNADWWVLDGAPLTTAVNSGGQATEHTLASIFGRVNYNFNEKYLASVVLRRDGSSRFGSSERYAVFPSVSLGWILSEENFWKVPKVDFFKFKGSWGINGNENIGDSRFISTVVTGVRTYEFGKTYGVASSESFVQGSSPEVLHNPAIKWEETSSFDVGIDMDMFKGKLHVEVDYFQKRTKDLLILNDAIPDFAGTRPSEANLGEVQNRGLEFLVSHKRSFDNGLSLYANLNGTFIKNEVLKVPNANKFVDGAIYPVFNAVITRMEQGKPMGYFRGYHVLGVFQNDQEIQNHRTGDDVIQPDASPGDFMFADINQDGQITSDDLTDRGKPWADFTMGLSFGAEYKGLDFSFMMTGSFGNDIYMATDRPEVAFRNVGAHWADRWTPDNPSNTIPRAGNDGVNLAPSDFMIEDGSYVRFRNIQLGYTVPERFLAQAGIDKVRAYLALDNFITITGYKGFDPEIGTRGNILEYGIDWGFYPTPKTVRIGLNVTL